MGGGKSKLHNKSVGKGGSPYTRDTETNTEPIRELLSREPNPENLATFDALSSQKRDETLEVSKGLSDFVVYEPLDEVLEAKNILKFRIFTNLAHEVAVIVSWKEGNFQRMVNTYKLKQKSSGSFEGYVPIVGELVELVVPATDGKHTDQGKNITRYRCLQKWQVIPPLSKTAVQTTRKNELDRIRFNEDFSPISHCFPDVNCYNSRLVTLKFKVDLCIPEIIAKLSHPTDAKQDFPQNVFAVRATADEIVTVFVTFTDKMPSSVMLSIEGVTVEGMKRFSPTKPKRGMTENLVATYLLTNFARVNTGNSAFPVINSHSLENCLQHPLSGKLQTGSSFQFQIKSRPSPLLMNQKVWYVHTGGNYFRLGHDSEGHHSGLVQIGLDGATLGYILSSTLSFSSSPDSKPEGEFVTYASYESYRSDRSLTTENLSSYLNFSARNSLDYMNSCNTECFEDLCGDMFVLEEDCGFDHLKVEEVYAPFANGSLMKKPLFPLIDVLGADKVTCRLEVPADSVVQAITLEDERKEQFENMIKWKQTQSRLNLTAYFPHEGEYCVVVHFGRSAAPVDIIDHECNWTKLNLGEIRITVLGTGAFFRSISSKFPQI